MSNRFHNKFHRHNHHTSPTDRQSLYPDSAYDPIASPESPFKGEFYAADQIITEKSLSARHDLFSYNGFFGQNVYITNNVEVSGNGIIENNLHVFKDLTIGKDVWIKGDLTVEGEWTMLDTYVSVTSALSVVNAGTGPAVQIIQSGNEPIAEFYDDNKIALFIGGTSNDPGYVGIGTKTPNSKLTVMGNISGHHTLVAMNSSVASGDGSFAANSSFALGNNSFAAGLNTRAEKTNSSSFGSHTKAFGKDSFVAGNLSITGPNNDPNHFTNSSFAAGFAVAAASPFSHAEGYKTSTGAAVYIESYDSQARKFTFFSSTSSLLSYVLPGTEIVGFSSLTSFNVKVESRNSTDGSIIVTSATNPSWISSFVADPRFDPTSYFVTSNSLYSHAEGYLSQSIGIGSHAEGTNSKATGIFSHAEGGFSEAVGSYSHAEGYQTKAYGMYAHTEGRSTSAIDDFTHAEGYGTKASNDQSHAEGYFTVASGPHSHSEGNTTIASGFASHAEGTQTLASEHSTHSEGYKTIALSAYSHAEGWSTEAHGVASHAQGYKTAALSAYSHAEGAETKARGVASHAEGSNTFASGIASHAEGYFTTAEIVSGSLLYPYSSHAEGYFTRASAPASHAEGAETKALNNASHAEGNVTTASGIASHAEGSFTTASGDYSHAEGRLTIASGIASHSEGQNTTASGYGSHSEGLSSIASGQGSHAEGLSSIASGQGSHAEGLSSIASGIVSHAAGCKATAAHNYSYIWSGDSSTVQRISTTKDSQYVINAPGDVYLSEGSFGINTDTPLASLHVATTDAVIIPVGNISERVSVKGAIRYNSELSAFEGYSGNVWGTLGGVMDVDQDTYIIPENTPGSDNDQLKFYTAGTQRAIINEVGKVGIGTGTPNEMLTITGNVSTQGLIYSKELDFSSLERPSLTGIKGALDAFLYTPVAVSYVRLNGGTSQVFEVGQTFSTPTVTWLSNKPEPQAITQFRLTLPNGSVSTGNHTYTSFNDPNTYVIDLLPGTTTNVVSSWIVQATDWKGGVASGTATANWRYRMYFGTTASTAPSTAEIFAGAEHNTLATSRTALGTRTVTPNAEYFFVAYPKRFGATTMMVVNNLNFNDFTQTEIQFQNSFGAVTEYYVYRSNNLLYTNYNIAVT